MRPPPEPLPIGAEWLRAMPSRQGEVPPPGTPVQEFHRRTVTERTSRKNTQVVEWLYASVQAGNMNGGTATNTAVRAWVQNQVGLPKDDAGHIIGNRLGGLGTVPWNIFPQSSNFNRGVFNTDVEQTIRHATARGSVRIWFRFYYNDPANPGRPNRFSFYVLFPDGQVMQSDLENPYQGRIMG